LRTFRAARQGAATVVLATLPAPQPGELEAWLDHAAAIAAGVDALYLPAPATAARRIDPLALCALLLRRGIDPLPQLAGDDRNRIALHSDLLGLRALGVSGIVVGGAPGADPDERGRTAAGLDAAELAATACALADEDWRGARHEFLVGAALDIDRPASGAAAEAVAAGARFLLTGPVTDTDRLGPFLRELVADRLTWRCAVIVTLAPPAAANAGLVAEIARLPGVSGVNLAGIGDAPALRRVLAALSGDGA